MGDEKKEKKEKKKKSKEKRYKVTILPSELETIGVTEKDPKNSVVSNAAREKLGLPELGRPVSETKSEVLKELGLGAKASQTEMMSAMLKKLKGN